jgi:ComF family protein
MIMKILLRLIDYLFPASCLGCEKIGSYLCDDCKFSVHTHPEICLYSHLHSQWFRTHLDERSNPSHYLDGCIIWFRYDGHIKKLIKNFKYHHQYHVGDFFAEQLSLHFLSNIYMHHCHQDNTLLTRVPSHRWRRYMVKWYNQSQLLAQSLAKILQYPCRWLAKKTKQTKSQAKLSREQRFSSLHNAFSSYTIESDHPIENIIIVDDVTTTWSTLNLLAKEIKRSYPHAQIRWLVVARHG